MQERYREINKDFLEKEGSSLMFDVFRHNRKKNKKTLKVI